MIKQRTRYQQGGTLIMALVFLMTFTVVFLSLAGLVSRTYHESILQAQDETAFQIAEAGINYARWRLAHDPENISVAEKTMEDPYAGVLGSYEVNFEEPQSGSTIVNITSVGSTANQPSRRVTLKVRYGRLSLARYVSITNGDVRYGGNISGAVHANGGIRMEGYSDSLMTSAKETYKCLKTFGCEAPYEIKPGIWGNGEESELWEFPVVPVDYEGMTNDLLDISQAAEATDTYYGFSYAYGYQIVFNDDNTFSIFRVTKKEPAVYSCAYVPKWTCGYYSHDVKNMSLVETKTVPSGGAIFIEDNVWVKGDIRDRVTVAAGRFPDKTSTNVDIILNGNITYGGVKDGSRVFAAIAQRNILIPYSGAPDNMEINGAYVAQKGSFLRRCYKNGLNKLKTSLIRYGMIASNGVPATAWLVDGNVVSGFQSGESVYDSNMLYGPPPYFPTSGQYQLISWEEEQ